MPIVGAGIFSFAMMGTLYVTYDMSSEKLLISLCPQCIQLTHTVVSRGRVPLRRQCDCSRDGHKIYVRFSFRFSVNRCSTGSVMVEGIPC